MSTLKVGNLQHPDSNTVSIQLNSAGEIVANNNMSVVGNLTTTGMVVPSSSYLRNRIINGDMRIDQRNAGASVTPIGFTTYTLDRWQYVAAQASKASIQQTSITLGGQTKAMLITSLSAYSVLTGDYFAVNQPIEGVNVYDLGWGAAGAQSVTLSFFVRSSLTGTFGGSIRNSAANRSYPFTYTISASNTWEYKTVTIPGDTTGTWLTDTGVGMYVTLGLGVGTTYSGSAGSWAAANYLSATGAVSVVGTNGATFYITGVQLEAGTVATPFERRQYGQELALCQRYFYTSYPTDTAIGAVLSSPLFASAQATCNYLGASFVFPSPMRGTPTITFYSTVNGATGVAGVDGVNKAVVGVGFQRGFYFYLNNTAVTVNQFMSAHVAANAEL